MLGAIGNEYDQMQCPYEASHILDRCRFQIHLNRCRQSFRNIPLTECPFNSTHLLNEPELDWHVTVCPDRKSFDNFKYIVATSTRSVPAPVEEMPKMETTENWDDEPDVPGYNPKVYAENAAVLRLCQNAPPSKRKKFRKAEHLRLKGMENA